jgi:hypothetical protein
VKLIVASVSLVTCLVVLTGCRQGDGPPPPSMADTSNRIGDIGRDLLSCSAGDASAKQDLGDDVKAFADSRNGEAAAQGLTDALADALRGRKLSDEQAQQLAHSSWMAVAGRQFSERQVSRLQDDFRTQLSAVGASQPAIQAVTEQVAATQQALGTRRRRWYELF